MALPLDLTNVKVSETFPRLVQIATGAFYDGLGNPISFPSGSATGATGSTGATGPSGANGLNGTSLSTIYSAGPGGIPTIIPGTITLNSLSDVVNSSEYFNSNDLGIYFQSKLPNINPGDQIYLGLFIYGGGLAYYGYLYDNGGPYIEIYNGLVLIASGNYSPGDLFSIYLDGVNINYNLAGGFYTSPQALNGLFACTLMLSAFSGTPSIFTQFLYYPTGRKGLNGSTGATGTPGATGSGATGATGPEGLNLATSLYKFSTNTSDSDPGSGYLKLNNINLTFANKVWIDYINDDGIDISNFLSIFTIGSKFYIQTRSDSSRFFIYEIISKTDKTGYYEFGLNFISNGTITVFSNNEKLSIAISFIGVQGQIGPTGPTGAGETGPTGSQGPTGPAGVGIASFAYAWFIS